MSGAGWLEALISDAEIGLTAALQDAPKTMLFLADDAAFEVLAAVLHPGPRDNLARLRHGAVRLGLNFAFTRVVVVSNENEDAARDSFLAGLRRDKVPEALLRTMRFDGFVADFLPSVILKRPPSDEAKPSTARLYAIVNTPRAGSTHLGSLLTSASVGDPIEHLRPWAVNLLKLRPPQLFDFVRLIRNFIAEGAVGGYFGTKIISHFLMDVLPLLQPAERSFLNLLIERTDVIYLSRADKLDQAISTVRARATGVWHATGAGKTLAPGALPEDFETVDKLLQSAMQMERGLAQVLVGAGRVLPVDYDELTEHPDRTLEDVFAFLGARPAMAPQSAFSKLADEASHVLRVRYLDVRGRSEADVRLTGAAALAEARATDEAEQARLSEVATRIRDGHARSINGDYQDRHYYLIEYDPTPAPGLDFLCRGPAPEEGAPYIAFVGASQTFGAFVQTPFPRRTAENLDHQAFNLGRGGAGPSFFSRHGPALDVVRKADAVVVQAMAARMEGNSRMESTEGRALVHFQDGGQSMAMDCDTAWRKIVEQETPERVLELVAESRRSWLGAMRTIAEAAEGPSVLVWFSERTPDYEVNLRDQYALFNAFPHLVDRAMIDEARTFFSDYVEIVSSAGLPEPTRSAFSGEVLPVVFGGGNLDEQNLGSENAYYPSQVMHEEVAAQLTPVLAKLIRRRKAKLSI
jgi:LPS sulfotransferase NodH